MNFRKWIVLVALLVAGVASSSAQNAALKTNLLGWATTNANIGAEVGIGRKSTVNMFLTYNPWDYGNLKRTRFWNVMPEYRYWFCEKFNGSFIGIHALGGQYNFRNVKFITMFGFPDITKEESRPKVMNDGKLKAWHLEGAYYGAGLTYGYQWMLSKNWNLEAEIGLGFAKTQYTLYKRCNIVKEKKNITYVGPTKIGVSAMYVF